MVKCKYGKLASPVRNPRTGFVRHCKLKVKSSAGKKQDRRKKSKEFHEVRYRKKVRGKGK